MRIRPLARLAFACLLVHPFFVRPALAGGIGISEPPEPDTVVVAAPTADSVHRQVPFHFYKIPQTRAPFANRDLELHWSDTYKSTFGTPLDVLGSDAMNDLDRLGATLCDVPNENPLGVPWTDMRLDHDYLAQSESYRSNTYDPSLTRPGFFVAQPSYPDAERNHIDLYVFSRAFSGHATFGSYRGDSVVISTNPLAVTFPQYASAPAAFTSPAEDSLTADPATYHANSLQVYGPMPWEVGRTDAARWTRPSGIANAGFGHEFIHALNNDGVGTGYSRLHMFASAGEVITGIYPATPSFDVDYTVSLIREDNNSYQGWMGFTAYLAYGYRGADTTDAIFQDDLLRRWATGPSSEKNLWGLGLRMRDEEFPEHGRYPYFDGLSGHDRAQLLLHNWRVAMYVNCPSLANGQFGYAPRYDFAPAVQLGCWQNLDGTTADDSLAIPPVFALGTEDRNQDRWFTEYPATANFGSRPLRMNMFGAEYCILSAEPGLANTQQDLQVRVRLAEMLKYQVRHYVYGPGNSCVLDSANTVTSSGRLHVSVVSYSQASDSLFRHPEWITGIVTESAPLDSVGGDLEFEIPNFGSSTRAVLVVATLGDGSEGWHAKQFYDVHSYPLVLGASLRGVPAMTPNPRAVTTSMREERAPTWSPDGSKLAYEGVDASGHRGIFTVTATGGVATALCPGTPAQYEPAWSARGDLIAFTQASSNGRDLWAVAADGSAPQQITNRRGEAHEPAFSPSGARILYFFFAQDTLPRDTVSVPAGSLPARWWEVRRYDLASGEDLLLNTLTEDANPSGPRWSPDGQSLLFRATDGGGASHLYRLNPQSGLLADRSYLAPAARQGEPSPGAGPMLVEENSGRYWVSDCEPFPPVYCFPCPPQPILAPAHWIALRDTLAGTSTPIRFRTGAEFSQPRWSPDGTKVAYVTTQNGNPDVYIASTTFDRAPVHSHSQTYYQAPACEPWYYLPMAVDPDGDPILYEVFGLPSGASSGTNGMITWQYPVVGNYWMVVRALDPQGALASRVLHLEIVDQATCGGGGGEEDPGPDEYGVRGRQAGSNRLIGGGTSGLARIANSILDGAAGGEWTAQTVRLVAAKSDSAGQARTRLVTVKPGVMKLDRARLLVVDHDPGTVAVATPAGLAVGAKHRAAHVATDAGDDLAQALKGADADVRLFTAGSTLSLTWAAGDEIAGLLLDCARASAADPASEWGVAVEVPNGEGWTVAGRIHPRSSYDALAAPIANGTPVRLTFVTDTYVRELSGYSLGEMEGGAATVTPVELSGTDVASGVETLASTDEAAVELPEGQGVTLLFDGPAPVEGRQRTLFLDLVASFTPAAVSGASSRSTDEGLPVRFALRGNQPNPFGGGTTIRFDAPRTAAIQIVVFDAQGRRIRTLAEGPFAPGTHAVVWDGTDAAGQRVRPGVYLYRMSAPGFRDQGRMVLLGR